jgi:hypothetical protein
MTDTFFYNNFLNNNDKTHDIKIKISRLSEKVININPVPIFINENIKCSNLINTNLKKFISNNFDSSIIKLETALKERPPEFLFTDQDSVANINFIMNYRNNMYINVLHNEVTDGIKDILKNVYNFHGEFDVVHHKSTVLTYDNFTFLNTHKHFVNDYEFNNYNKRILNIVGAYYIDDGDPETINKYCGCISFLSNNKAFHIRPKNGTLVLWEGNLQHLVNPFISKTNEKRQVITMNIEVIF